MINKKKLVKENTLREREREREREIFKIVYKQIS